MAIVRDRFVKSFVILALGFATSSCFSGGSGDGDSMGSPDAAPSRDGAPQVDAGPFVCADDSAIEPNDNLKTATNTGIPGIQSEVRYVGLAMCSTTDRDVFGVRVDQNGASLFAEVLYESDRAQLTLELLTGAGTVIASGEPDATLADRITVALPNAPTGQYFVRVSAEFGATNYEITMSAQ
jgi:hypothetical protein